MPKIGIGLDIGSNSVKLVELTAGNKRAARLNRFQMIALPDGVISNGVVADQTVVSEAVDELFRKSKISLRRVVIAISQQAVIVRHIKMPVMEDDQLGNAIQYEAERYIPFQLDEVTLDYKIIGKDPQQDELEIMLVCARNDIIASHVETLRQIKVQPLAVDIQPLALMRIFGLDSPLVQGSIALLDLGAGTTDLTIFKDGVPRFTRIIPMAGHRFTSTVSGSLSLPFEEAEEYKVNYSDALYNIQQAAPDSPEFKVNFAILEGLRELAMELRRSFDYYQLQQRNEEIKRVVVTGGGARLKNIIQFLRNELNVPVECGLTDKVICPDKLKNQFMLEFPVFATALGLGLREVIDDEN